MKKTLTVTTLALLAGAVSGYSQGQLTMVDYGGIQVFSQQPSSGGPVVTSYGGKSGNETMGASGNSYSHSPGTANYAPGTAVGGTAYDVQLLIGAGTGLTLSSLSPAGPVINTWYIGNNQNPLTPYAGEWSSAANVTFGTAGQAVTIAIAAWNNEGGTVTSLAAAQAANDPWGASSAVNFTMGGGSQPPAGLPFGTIAGTDLQSFSLAVTPSPEPATIALGVIGASTLLFRRRK